MATYTFDGYKLTLRDTFNRDGMGKAILSYTLVSPSGVKLFSGADFHASPMHKAISRDSALALLGFLTLRPGDTDREYFDSYTPEQLAWAKSYDCEMLASYATA